MGDPDDRSPSQSEVRHKNTMGFMGIFKDVLNKEYQGAYLEQCSWFWHKAILFTSLLSIVFSSEYEVSNFENNLALSAASV